MPLSAISDRINYTSKSPDQLAHINARLEYLDYEIAETKQQIAEMEARINVDLGWHHENGRLMTVKEVDKMLDPDRLCRKAEKEGRRIDREIERVQKERERFWKMMEKGELDEQYKCNILY